MKVRVQAHIVTAEARPAGAVAGLMREYMPQLRRAADRRSNAPERVGVCVCVADEGCSL